MEDLLPGPSRDPADLDRLLRYYNPERSHHGYRLQGRTPAEALREALGSEALPPIVPRRKKKAKKTAA